MSEKSRDLAAFDKFERQIEFSQVLLIHKCLDLNFNLYLEHLKLAINSSYISLKTYGACAKKIVSTKN